MKSINIELFRTIQRNKTSIGRVIDAITVKALNFGRAGPIIKSMLLHEAKLEDNHTLQVASDCLN